MTVRLPFVYRIGSFTDWRRRAAEWRALPRPDAGGFVVGAIHTAKGSVNLLAKDTLLLKLYLLLHVRPQTPTNLESLFERAARDGKVIGRWRAMNAAEHPGGVALQHAITVVIDRAG